MKRPCQQKLQEHKLLQYWMIVAQQLQKGVPESTINDSGSRLVSNQDDTTNSTHNLHALIMSQGDQTVPIVLDRLENKEHVSPENNTIQSTGVQDDAATHLIIPTLVGTSAFLHFALRGSVR
jgi:hypothetical protein